MATPVPITVTVNGVTHQHAVEPRTLLVYYLRETLGLTGTHVGCDTTSCGGGGVHNPPQWSGGEILHAAGTRCGTPPARWLPGEPQRGSALAGLSQ